MASSPSPAPSTPREPFDIDEMNDEINACVEQPPSDPSSSSPHDHRPHQGLGSGPGLLTRQHDRQGLGPGLGASTGLSAAEEGDTTTSTTTTALLLTNPRMSYSGRWRRIRRTESHVMSCHVTYLPVFLSIHSSFRLSIDRPTPSDIHTL